MPQTSPFPHLKGLKRVAFILICFWLVILTIGVNRLLYHIQAASDPSLPFGVSTYQGEILAQDFSYNMLFFKGIKERLVSHPYRLEDQEKMMRHIMPEMTTGMSHAYSPVAFVLTLPMLKLPGGDLYLIYTVICAVGIALLVYFCLLPKVSHPEQLLALLICTLSAWLTTSFAVGQSTLITTSLLGGFWYLLQRRSDASSLSLDMTIATLFWALCLKPSVAIIPAMLLLGFKAWRTLLIGSGMLLATWVFVSGYYGGWLAGLSDYLYLLNHYHNGDFTPFVQRFQETAQARHQTALLFSVDRDLLLISFFILLVLRWMERITASDQFQGMVWLFLLLCPYLLATENWVLCLLVVEGVFFQSTHRILFYGKLLLLAAIFNLRMGVTSPLQVEYPLKCLLFFWMSAEWLLLKTALASNKNQEARQSSGAIPEC